MATKDDEIRGQVLSLFSACDNDVRLLLERTVRALQEAGRHDIKLDKDGSGAVFVVSQGASHARGHLSFKQQLEQMQVNKAAEKAKKRIEEITVNAVDGLNVPTFEQFQQEQKRARSAAKLRGQSADKKDLEYRKHLEGGKRCFEQTERDLKLASFPTSKYSGNYTLFRYGGAFPPHANYGFYRRYGSDGRGAAGAEFHNFPNGERPDTQHIYQ
jgi:hypothetical protein